MSISPTNLERLIELTDDVDSLGCVGSECTAPRDTKLGEYNSTGYLEDGSYICTSCRAGLVMDAVR